MRSETAWGVLAVAGLLETVWAVGLKYTEGFTRMWPTTWTLAAMIASMLLLGQAVRVIPVGTGYAVWTGIGAVGTAVIGMAVMGESRALPRVFCIALIVLGVLGLRFASSGGR